MIEWKLGDVAMAEYGHGLRDIALRLDPRGWEVPGGHLKDGDHAGTTFRPLVVIDPEDAEQVERIGAICYDAIDAGEDLQAALREFAAPPPPKPAEPQGLGAVVEDADGNRWVRLTGPDLTFSWRTEGHGSGYSDNRYWSLVPAVRVLSEGVSGE